MSFKNLAAIFFATFCCCTQIISQEPLKKALSATNPIEFSNQFQISLPTNDIVLGVEKSSTFTNIIVCLFPHTQSAKQLNWIAPPHFQRATYSLFDNSNKSVPYLKKFYPDGKIYTNISEIPKDRHNVHLGTIWGPPFTMPYDRLNLMSAFKIEHDGDYTLVVKGRIMKVLNDGRLDLVEFPSVSFKIHIQTM